MTNQDHNSFALNHCFAKQSPKFGARMIFEKSAVPESSEAANNNIDPFDKNFDEALNGKEAKFDKTKQERALEKAIIDLVDHIQNLDKKVIVKKDLIAGLTESAQKNMWGNDLTTLSKELVKNNCEKILLYKRTNGTLEFKFFNKTAEIIVHHDAVPINFTFVPKSEQVAKSAEKTPADKTVDQFNQAGEKAKILEEKFNTTSNVRFKLPASESNESADIFTDTNGKITKEQISNKNFRRSGIDAPKFLEVSIIDNQVIQIGDNKYVKARFNTPNQTGEQIAWIPSNSVQTKNPRAATTSSAFQEAFGQNDSLNATDETLPRTDGKVFLDHPTQLVDKNTGNPLPPISPDDSQYLKVINNTVYIINEEKYVQVHYANGAVNRDGWLKVSDMVLDKFISTEANKEKSDFDAKNKLAEMRKAGLQNNLDQTVKFSDQKEASKKTLKEIYGNIAQQGDSVMVNEYPKAGLPAKEAFYDAKKQDFYYKSGERAKVLDGSTFSALKTNRSFQEKDEAPNENVTTIGRFRVNENENQMFFYTDLAEKILDPNTDPNTTVEQLKAAGIIISDEKLLNDLRASRPSISEYASALETNRRGNNIFIFYSPDFNKAKLAKMKTEAAERRAKEKTEQTEIDSKSIQKAEADMFENKNALKQIFDIFAKTGDNPEDDKQLRDNKFQLDSNTYNEFYGILGKDWKTAWDNGQIKGKENLTQVWKRTFGRSENELRDFTFQFFSASQEFNRGGNVTLNDMLGVLAQNCNITDKEHKAFTAQSLLTERSNAKKAFDDFETANGNFIENQVLRNPPGPDVQLYNFAIQLKKENIIAGRNPMYGLDKTIPDDLLKRTYESLLMDQKVVNGLNLYVNYQRYDKIYKGSLLMLDALTKVKFDGNAIKESHEQTRPLDPAEQALNSVFNLNDAGNSTMHDIAGNEGREGKIQSIRLLPWLQDVKEIPVVGIIGAPLSALSSNLSPNHVNTLFERYASGESAFLRIKDRVSDNNIVNPEKLKAELNRLVYLGAHSFKLLEKDSYAKFFDLSNLFRSKGDSTYDEALNAAEAKPDEENLEAVATKLYQKLKFDNVDGALNLSDIQKTIVELGYVIDLTGAGAQIETAPEKFYQSPEEISDKTDVRYLDYQGMLVGLKKLDVQKLSELAKTPGQRMALAEMLRIYKTPKAALELFNTQQALLEKANYSAENQELVWDLSYKALQSYRTQQFKIDEYLKFVNTAGEQLDRNMKAIDADLAKIKEAGPKASDAVIAGLGIKVGKGGGIGFGFGIPLNDSTIIAASISKMNGNWQLGAGIGKEWKLQEGMSLEAGIGSSIPLNDPLNFKEWGVGAGPALKIKIGEIGNYDINVLPAAGVALSKNGLSAGPAIGVGLEYDSERALAAEVRNRLKNLRLEEVDQALLKSPAEAVDLLIKDPLLGKTMLALRNEYNLSDNDLVRVYKDQRDIIASTAANNIRPFLLKAGVGVGLNVGLTGKNEGKVTLGIGGALVIGLAQIAKVYQFEKTTTKEALENADKTLDAKTQKYITERLPVGMTLNNQMEVFTEGKAIIVTLDGKKQIAQEATEKDQSLKAVRDRLLKLGKVPTIQDYNDALIESGIALAPEENGLLRLAIPELEFKEDPTYEKRDTKVYIDPQMKAKNKSALVLKDGSVYLATDSQPELFVRRITYYTPKRGQEAAAAHTIVILTDLPSSTSSELPSRTSDEIMKASRFFISKAPGRAIELVDVQNDRTQNNVLNGDTVEGQTARENFGKYEAPANQEIAKNLEEAMLERQKQFVELGNEVREGIVPFKYGKIDENDQKTDCFAKRFYDKNKLEFKKLTTATKPGEDMSPKLAALEKLIKSEAAKDEKLKKTVDGGQLGNSEVLAINADLTRRSWSDIRDKSPQERQKLFESRIEMARTVLKPHWIEAGRKMDPKLTPEQSTDLLNITLNKTKLDDIDLQKEQLDEDYITTTFAGTQGIEGLRPNTNVLQLRNLKHFEAQIHEDSIEGKLAKFILDSQSPVPKEDAQFVQSPLALRAFSKLALIETFGAGGFNDITNYFKSGGLDNTGTPAVAEFKDLVNKIRNQELLGLSNTFFTFKSNGGEKEIYIKVKTLVIGSGLDDRCTNFSTTVKEDFDVYSGSNGNADKPLAYGDLARTATSIGAADQAINLGVGIGLALSVTPKPSSPERHTPPSNTRDPQPAASVNQDPKRPGDPATDPNAKVTDGAPGT